MITSLNAPIERTLLALWEASDTLFGPEAERAFGGLLYRAWDEDDQRQTLRFIQPAPITKSAFDDLALDLADTLRNERSHQRDGEIRYLLAESKPIGEAQAEASDFANEYAADHVKVYVLDSHLDDATRRADLQGAYWPGIILHVVPDRFVEENP